MRDKYNLNTLGGAEHEVPETGNLFLHIIQVFNWINWKEQGPGNHCWKSLKSGRHGRRTVYLTQMDGGMSKCSSKISILSVHNFIVQPNFQYNFIICQF